MTAAAAVEIVFAEIVVVVAAAAPDVEELDEDVVLRVLFEIHLDSLLISYEISAPVSIVFRSKLLSRKKSQILWVRSRKFHRAGMTRKGSEDIS